MVTTNQKHTIDSQKPKRREHKHNTKENHQTTKGKTKKKGTKKKYKIKGKTKFKMAINTYLSIITLNVNGLNTSIKRQSGRLDKKARAYNMLPTKDPL